MRTKLALVAAIAGMLAWTGKGLATSFTWDGGGDGSTWTDPNNWDLNSSYPQTTSDTATFNGAANVTAGLPQTIHFLTTGTGLVQFNNTLNFGPNADPQGASIGTGGISVTGNLNSGVRSFTSAGPVTITGQLQTSAYLQTQTGSSTWDIHTLTLPQGGGNIPAWNILNGANTTINESYTSGNFAFTATPNITGGRPDWTLTGGAPSTFDVASYTLYGRNLQLDGWPGGAGRYGVLTANNGTLDLNTIAVGYGNASNGNTYIALTHATVGIHGNGTANNPAWDNRSTNTTSWSLTGGTAGYTTVTFDSPSGTQLVHTGSTDSGTGGYTNNFAFGNVKIGTGTTVQLSDNNAPNALDTLYVKGYLQGGNGSTLNLNGHNAYVDGGLTPGLSVGNMTITATGGAFALTNNAEVLTFELGPTDAFGVGLAGQNDHVQINGGTFTLDGILNMVDLGGENWSTGKLSYNLFSYTGSLVNNGLELGSGFPGPAFLDFSTAGQVNLIITPEPGMALLGLVGAGLMAIRRRRNCGA